MVLIFACLLTEMKQFAFLSSGQCSLNATEHSPSWHSSKYGRARLFLTWIYIIELLVTQSWCNGLSLLHRQPFHPTIRWPALQRGLATSTATTCFYHWTAFCSWKCRYKRDVTSLRKELKNKWLRPMGVAAKYCFLVGLLELTAQCEHDICKAMKKSWKNLANSV